MLASPFGDTAATAGTLAPAPMTPPALRYGGGSVGEDSGDSGQFALSVYHADQAAGVRAVGIVDEAVIIHAN
jgi:hypothetical protein